MGYICPDCGEGLSEDTPSPCTMEDDAGRGSAGTPLSLPAAATA
jgi:hypothetical protein